MIQIETERLMLRNFRRADAADYCEYMSLEYTALHEDFSPFTPEQCEACAAERAQRDDYWAVELRGEGKVIGDLCYRERDFDTCEIGFDFNVRYGKKGYATEACRELLRYLFETRKARRVVAECNEENVNSMGLLERLGMRREGHFLEDVSFKTDERGDPVYVNSYLYAMLRREWKTAR